MLNNEVVNSALGAHYTEFSTAIKDSLKSKFNTNEFMQKYTAEIQKTQNFKTIFKSVSTSGEEK